MPELPEIETVKRIVGPQIVGHRIISVENDRPRMIGHPSPEEFCRKVNGRRILSCGRRGKAVLVGLDDGGHMIIRFGMTGQLVVVPKDFPAEKHTHLVLGLDDGRRILYIDPRMFGGIWYIAPGEDDTYSGIGRLGLEPFDEGLTAGYLEGKLGKRQVSIKEGLLDQSVVAGLGNIWADETLFRCRLCPETPCDEVPRTKWKLLAGTIPMVMDFAIEKNATTPEDYLEGMGRKYYDIGYLQAYGHEGDPCPVCGTPFVRSVLGGRSSYWCPKCQKRRRKRKAGTDCYKR